MRAARSRRLSGDGVITALGLSRFIRNPKTQPPVTIAFEGEWGEGKSSVMPGVEPHGTVAGLFEVATEQRHDRAFFLTPFAFDGDSDVRLGLGLADEPRECQR